MKYETLKVIEELLVKELSHRKSNVERVAKKLNQLYQDEEDGKPDFDPEDLEQCKRHKSVLSNYYDEAKEALDDFLEHDWR